MEPLYKGHHWDPAGCPVKRGFLNSEVDLYTAPCGWDCRQCPHYIEGCPLFRMSFTERIPEYSLVGQTSLACYTLLPALVQVLRRTGSRGYIACQTRVRFSLNHQTYNRVLELGGTNLYTQPQPARLHTSVLLVIIIKYLHPYIICIYNMLTYVGKQCIILSICLITAVTIRPGVYIHRFNSTHII